VWPRGCVSVSLVTRVRTAVSVPRPQGVCTGPAVSLCSVTVSQAGQGSCVTLQCAQTRAARSTAHAQSQARVGVNLAGLETSVTCVWLTQAVLTETATSPTTVTVSRDGQASSATSPRLWSLGLVPGRDDVNLWRPGGVSTVVQMSVYMMARDIGWETQCAGVLLATGAPGVS